MRQPNFFIVGAPKCGTTALAEYLSGHPQVFVSPCKEPHYFATDIPGIRVVPDKQKYEALFQQATPGHRAIGEASVFYLYSGEALPNICDYNPEARLIAMLRSPVELIHSLHAQYLYSRNEDVSDIGRAWAMAPARRKGKHIPRHCRDPKLLEYDRIAALGAQMERLLSVFPPEQVLWIFFDDFVRNTDAEYLRVLDFLNLEDDGRRQFQPVNQSKRHRLNAVGNFTQRPPRRLVTAGLWLKRQLGLSRLGLLHTLRRLNMVRTRRSPLPDDVRAALIANYREDVARLARLTGRSLDHWLKLG